MTARFMQVEKGRWPNGIDKPIAVLRAEPDELAQRYGLRFRAGSDDFDRFQEAALRLRSGRPVLLYRYERSPSAGTTVTIDEGDRAREALDELMAALEIRKRGITWVSDEVASNNTTIGGGAFSRLLADMFSWIALSAALWRRGRGRRGERPRRIEQGAVAGNKAVQRSE